MNVLDLFSGAGGLSLGFDLSGFNVLGAVESVKVFAETHDYNFNSSCTVHADLSKLKPNEFSKSTKIKKQDVDIIIGGPPCQTFSSIGHPKINSLEGRSILTDPRNYLFESYFEYVRYYKPAVFVMENVPQLITKYNGELFKKVCQEISDLGYKFNIRVLNAADYGVPQIRKRMIIVGWKFKSKVNFDFPEPMYQPPGDISEDGDINNLRKYNTVSDALSDLPKIYDGCRLGDLKYSKNNKLSDFQIFCRNDSGYVGNNVCRISNQRAKTVFSHMKQGSKYMDLDPEVRKILPFREDIFHDRLKRLVADKPSWTVLAHIGMDGYMYIHPWEDRTLSVREAARIQSFPDSFTFLGNMREQYVQVGNAVPPLLAKAIAGQVSRVFS